MRGTKVGYDIGAARIAIRVECGYGRASPAPSPFRRHYALTFSACPAIVMISSGRFRFRCRRVSAGGTPLPAIRPPATPASRQTTSLEGGFPALLAPNRSRRARSPAAVNRRTPFRTLPESRRETRQGHDPDSGLCVDGGAPKCRRQCRSAANPGHRQLEQTR